MIIRRVCTSIFKLIRKKYRYYKGKCIYCGNFGDWSGMASGLYKCLACNKSQKIPKDKYK